MSRAAVIREVRFQMMETEALHALVAEVEESLGYDDIYCLYEFSWFLRGYDESLTEEQIDEACRAAYDEVRRRHSLKLAWVGWPTDLATATDAPPDVRLGFDIHSTGQPPVPMLALVPASMTDGPDADT